MTDDAAGRDGAIKLALMAEMDNRLDEANSHYDGLRKYLLETLDDLVRLDILAPAQADAQLRRFDLTAEMWGALVRLRIEGLSVERTLAEDPAFGEEAARLRRRIAGEVHQLGFDTADDVRRR
jgi:hypothetical protein